MMSDIQLKLLEKTAFQLKNQKTAKVLPIALKEKWFKPARLNEVLEYEGFTGKQIAERILGTKVKAAQPKIALTEFAE
jgi:transketolase